MGSKWSSISDDKRMDLLRRKLAGEDVGVLATEVGMNTTTLNRRLQEFRSDNPIEIKEPVDGASQPSRTVAYPEVKMNAAVFDIETTDFNTSGINGHLVCTVVLPLGAKKATVHQIEFSDNRDDRRLLQEVLDDLSKYDILIGHNIKAFDLNWLYSRNMYFGGGKLPAWNVYDTYQAARGIAIKIESKSLGALGSYFGVKGNKTRIFRTDWSMVDSPNEEEFNRAIQEIVDHCVADVQLNRGVFNALWAYDPKRQLSKTKW